MKLKDVLVKCACQCQGPLRRLCVKPKVKPKPKADL